MSLDELDLLATGVLRTARLCFEQRLQTGTGGNISVRVPGREAMMVKARGTSFLESERGAVVLADFDAHGLEEGVPSKESPLHGAIYRRMPDVGAIVHVHSPWAVAWTMGHSVLPAVTYHSQLKFGGPLDVVDTGTYTVPDSMLDEVVGKLGDGRPAVLLAKHGVVGVGVDLDSARQVVELVEETANVALLSLLAAGPSIGGVRPEPHHPEERS